MATRVREAPGYVAYMKLLVDRRAGALAVKERVVRHLLADVSRVSDPVLQELYAKELSRTFGLSESTVAAGLAKKKSSGAALVEASTRTADADPASVAVRQARRELLRIGLVNRADAGRLLSELEAEDFGAGLERRLFEAIETAGPDGHWRDHAADSDTESLGSELEFEGPPPGDPEQLLRDYRATLLAARLDKSGAELRRRLAEADARGDEEAADRLLAEKSVLARDRSELRRPPTSS